MAARRNARILFRLGVALIWIALALVLLEVFARFQFRSIDRDNPLVLEYKHMLEVYDEQEESLWEVPYWRYRKNAELIVRDGDDTYHVTTNSLGFRGEEIEIPKPLGVFRIVCVGGSTTVGGWTDETTYPAFLERELRRRLDDRVVIEVVNAGISGLNSEGERKKAADYLALDPDLIVEYNVVNDLAWRINPALREEAGGGRRLLGRSEFVRAHLGGWIEPAPDRLVEHLRATTLANLLELGRQVKQAGVDFGVASFAYPDRAEVDQALRDFLDHNAITYWGLREMSYAGYQRAVELYNRELERMAAEAGFLYLPIAETFTGVEAHYIDICHLDREGMELKAIAFADALEPYLIERLGSS